MFYTFSQVNKMKSLIEKNLLPLTLSTNLFILHADNKKKTKKKTNVYSL